MPAHPDRRVRISLYSARWHLAAISPPASVEVDHAASERDHEIATDRIRAQIESARAEGATEITFTGDESATDSRLPELIAWARGKGFARVGIETHGEILACSGMASVFASAGLTDVHTMLHSADAAAHDYHAGVDGSFAATLAGIGAARAAGLIVVLSTTLTRSNHRVLADLPALIASRGVSAWCVWVPRIELARTAAPDRFVPRLALALPYALHAIEISRRRRIPAWIAGAPLCLLGPYAAHALLDGPRAYGEPCTPCPSRERCSGLDPWYLARFGGDEISARDAPPLRDDAASLRRMFIAE